MSLFSADKYTTNPFKIQVHVYRIFYLEDTAYMGPWKRLKTDAKDQW